MTGFLAPLLLLAAVLMPMPAASHFLTDSQSREFHIVPTDGGTAEVLMRFPLTFAYAAELAGRTGPDDPMAAPFLLHEYVAGRSFYRFDRNAATADPAAFGDFLLRDFQFSVDGRIVESVLRSVATVLVPTGSRPPTGRLELEANLRDREDLATGYVSELAVVAAVTVPGSGTGHKVGLKVTAPRFVLPQNLHVANQYTDHRSRPAESVTKNGFWPDAVTLSGSPMASFAHFTSQGVIHVLGGVDHLLFVICLGLVASNWHRLLFSVTGFTVGHSITLSAGVFGFMPRSEWFIPTVELGVALSIVMMAALILVKRSGPTGFWIAASLGLLHGFGFAFMLTPMLGDGGFLLPLAAFNVGIELGQLLIVLPLMAALLYVDSKVPQGGSALRLTAAGAAAIIALVMTYHRTETIIATIVETSVTATEQLHDYLSQPYLGAIDQERHSGRRAHPGDEGIDFNHVRSRSPLRWRDPTLMERHIGA